MQKEKAKELFRKLKIQTLLDLALIVPSSYNDTTLSSMLEIGKVHTLEARVVDTKVFGGKLRVTFELPKFGRKISSTFFRTTPYHHKLFVVGSMHYIQGRLEEYRGYLQMSQPLSIKQVGRITPKYKTAIKEEEMHSLIQTYITEQYLYNEGLDSREVAALMHLHFPKSIEEVYSEGSLRGEFVEILKFVEAYNHLRKLRKKRVDYSAMEALRGDIAEFVDGLPFELTEDQTRVIEEIRSDLARTDKAAKRMVVGDVGSGKTMVILASAMMALPHRSILMAPTSLLAQQLYEEAIKHLPSRVKVALVMQGRNEGDYKEADFIIGTHALLYLDDLPYAPLVMVDEQHRFGTKQRQRLEMMVNRSEELGIRNEEVGVSVGRGVPASTMDNKNSTHYPLPTTHSKGSDPQTIHGSATNHLRSDSRRPHYLQFSATPIPRTQAMMESELLDVSLITSTPFEKRITTSVIGRGDFGDLLEHIKGRISAKEQVLIVYPLVEESDQVPYQSLDEARDFWESRFEHVYVTHGKDKDKDEVLLEFREQGDILLATTVVEVGISLPRLTTIVIVGAERLGLATLHQLRGRVGRHGQESWCFLYTNSAQGSEFRVQDVGRGIPTQTSDKRRVKSEELRVRDGRGQVIHDSSLRDKSQIIRPLMRLQQFAQTTNGFEIAKLDLQYRDSGDILDGTIQSGQKFKWLDMAEDEEIIKRAKGRVGN